MRYIYGFGILIILITFILDIWLPINYWEAAAWSLTCGAVFVSFFTLRYSIWSNWKSNRIGVILFTKSILLTVAMWQIVISTWWGTDYPFRHQIRFVIYAFFALAYITMDVALIREQKRDRNSLRDIEEDVHDR